MSLAKVTFSVFVPFAIFLCAPLSALHAEELLHADIAPKTASTRFNNENWQISVQPVVASFTSNPDGSSYGLTTDGIPFKQYTVSEITGVKVQRFEIQDHYHFIVEGEIAYSLEVLSSILAHKEKRSH